MAQNTPPIILQTGQQPRYSIIWLHGLGADVQDFVPVVDELQLPVAVRYIFPHAPMRPVTVNGGFVMRAWYDITGMNIAAQQDSAGIRSSQALVESLITKEVSLGIQTNHIFLAGFSQGGAIALHTALRQTVPLGGVIALSTYLPLAESAAKEFQDSTLTSPIFMAHGLGDQVVPYALGAFSRDALRNLGFRVAWHEYPMPHSVCNEELQDIAAWLGMQIRK